MSSSTITVSHDLGQDEALRRIRGILGDTQHPKGDRLSDLQESWSGNNGTYSFRIGGFQVRGSIDVRDSDVEIDVDYPLAARPFKEKIETTLRDRAETLLAA